MSRLDRLVDETRTALAMPMPLSHAELLPNSVGNAAFLHLGTAAAGAVLGLGVDETLLERDRRWLADSAARNEAFGDPPDYFAMLHREALALSTWMLTGRSDRAVFADAVRRHELALDLLAASAMIAPDELVRGYLPDLVRDCFSAGRYDRGGAGYERYVGPLPDGPDAVESPLQLAGWLCRQVGRLKPPADWVAVGGRVLRGRLLDWLDRGQGLDAALWLKVVYADSGAALTPADALRRGGELIGAVPADPLAQVMIDSLGDPVDVDLFGGFLAAAGTVAVGRGATITAEFGDRAPLTVPITDTEIATSLDEAIAGALVGAHPGSLTDRLTDAARGRIVDVDGQTPLTLQRITIR